MVHQRAQRTPRRETNINSLRVAMIRLVDKKTVNCGEIVYPSVPSLAPHYAGRLVVAWAALGRSFTPAEVAELTTLLQTAMTEGAKLSKFALVKVSYEAEPPPNGALRYEVQSVEQSPASHYEAYKQRRGENLFGQHADAKLLDLAALFEGTLSKVLDVGAGTGRNAVALARRGFAVDAIEVVPGMCDEIRAHSAAEGLAVNVVPGDFLAADVLPPSSDYQIVVVSEVLTQLDRGGVTVALVRAAEVLAPGGLLLINIFLAADGFKPDAPMREFSLTSLCCVYTRAELKSLTETLPLRLVSDESAFEFERQHLPPDAWPPTPWYESWALGSNLFDVPYGTAPFELRWLVYQRIAAHETASSSE